MMSSLAPFRRFSFVGAVVVAFAMAMWTGTAEGRALASTKIAETPGAAYPGPALAHHDNNNGLTVYTTDDNGDVRSADISSSGSLKSWDNLNGNCDSRPAAASFNSITLVVCADNSGSLWSTWDAEDGTRGGWSTQGGSCKTAPAVAVGPSGFHIFCVENDENVHSLSMGFDGTYTPFNDLSSPKTVHAPTAAGNDDHAVVAITTTLGVVAFSTNKGSGWSSWHTLAGAPPVAISGPPAVALYKNSMNIFYARDEDGAVYMRSEDQSDWAALSIFQCSSDLAATDACPTTGSSTCVSTACYDANGELWFYEASNQNDVNQEWQASGGFYP